MYCRPLRRIGLLCPLVALLALAAPASADDFCVTAAGQVAHEECDLPGDTESSDLNDAVADANGHPGPDRILIGPGTHPDPGAAANAAGDQDLTIDGSGRDSTFLPVSGNSDEIVHVNDPDSVVSDLEIQMADGENPNGIELNAGTIRRVDITGAPNSGYALFMAEGADAEDVDVDLTPSGSTNYGVYVYENGAETTTLTDVSARATYGVFLPSGVTVEQHRGVLRGGVIGLYLPGNGHSYTGDSVVIRGVGEAGHALGVQATSGGAETALELRNATLYTHVTGQTINVFAANGGTVDLDVTGSVMNGRGNPDVYLFASGTGTVVDVDLAYSSWRRSEFVTETSGTGSITVTEGPGNVPDVDPRFAKAGTGDVRLFGDSPLVDAGEPGPLAPGQSPLDYLRGDRLLDGDGDGTERRDIGADEFDPADPPPEPPDDGDGGGGGGDDGGGGGAPPPVPGPFVPPPDPPRVLPPPPILPPLSVRGGNRRLDRRGRVTFVVGCPAAAPGPCAGRVVLRRARRPLALGRKAFTLAPGQAGRVRVKVGRRGRRALRRAKRLRVRATVTASNASASQVTFVLRPRR